MKNKEGVYFEFSGSHCSCYGFEGQYDPEETTIEYLNSERFTFNTGGYDENDKENERKVKEFVNSINGESLR